MPMPSQAFKMPMAGGGLAQLGRAAGPQMTPQTQVPPQGPSGVMPMQTPPTGPTRTSGWQGTPPGMTSPPAQSSMPWGQTGAPSPSGLMSDVNTLRTDMRRDIGNPQAMQQDLQTFRTDLQGMMPGMGMGGMMRHPMANIPMAPGQMPTNPAQNIEGGIPGIGRFPWQR